MGRLKVTAKNQVTLRKEVMQHLGIRPGDELDFELRPDGRAELVAFRPRRQISDLVGLFKLRPGMPHLTLDEIEDAIAEGGAAAGMAGLEDR